ncbi:MAG: hypothetical protein M0Z85_05900 [Gammaproteobacteria bacterium]|nr:hypothetical protein [Gammaproteobacteria bacterium]
MNMKLPLAAILAAALPGVALASVHMWGLGNQTSTTVGVYQPQATTLVGQPPAAGALISQQSTSASGYGAGFLFRSAERLPTVLTVSGGLIVDGDKGAIAMGGGLTPVLAGPGVAFAHARTWMGMNGLFGLLASPVSVDVGAAVGYAKGRTNDMADIARFRVTPALSIGYKTVRLTYRQSPWSEPGMSAPRDVLVRYSFHGHGSLTMGTLVPDVRANATDGYVVAVQTPRFYGVGARLAYVSGFQGVINTGPFNPSRPWDSYSAGEFADVSYQAPAGVSIGLYVGVTHNTSSSATTTTITATSVRSRLAGLTLSDHF